MTTLRHWPVFSVATAIVLLSIGTLCGHETGPFFAGERILVHTTLNGEPTRFLYDTGAAFSGIFKPVADRLDVHSGETREVDIAGHSVLMGASKPMDVVMFGKESKSRFPILPFPATRGVDGVLGWRNLTAPALLIDGFERRVAAVNAPPETGWQRFAMEADASQVFFVVTQNGKPLGRVFIDTGAAIGLRVSPSLWKAWRNENPEAGVTLETFRYAVGDPMVHELAWADTFRLGDITFSNIDIGPIPEAKNGTAIDASGQEFIATIGIRALHHLRIIINRPDSELLVQSVSPIPRHNRLGAVFVPGPDGSLIARVLPESPAARSGLQTGDTLLTINGISFTAPEDHSGNAAPLRPEAFFSQPPGTELNLTIKRADATIELSVTLEDLIGK